MIYDIIVKEHAKMSEAIIDMDLRREFRDSLKRDLEESRSIHKYESVRFNKKLVKFKIGEYPLFNIKDFILKEIKDFDYIDLYIVIETKDGKLFDEDNNELLFIIMNYLAIFLDGYSVRSENISFINLLYKLETNNKKIKYNDSQIKIPIKRIKRKNLTIGNIQTRLILGRDLSLSTMSKTDHNINLYWLFKPYKKQKTIQYLPKISGVDGISLRSPDIKPKTYECKTQYNNNKKGEIEFQLFNFGTVAKYPMVLVLEIRCEKFLNINVNRIKYHFPTIEYIKLKFQDNYNKKNKIVLKDFIEETIFDSKFFIIFLDKDVDKIRKEFTYLSIKFEKETLTNNVYTKYLYIFN